MSKYHTLPHFLHTLVPQPHTTLFNFSLNSNFANENFAMMAVICLMNDSKNYLSQLNFNWQFYKELFLADRFCHWGLHLMQFLCRWPMVDLAKPFKNKFSMQTKKNHIGKLCDDDENQ